MDDVTTRAGWPDRYRPEKLEDMALAPDLRERFTRYLSGAALPRHLILYGPPGFGKTSIASIIATTLYRDDGWPRVRRVKSGETGNVDYIRTNVIESMRTLPSPRLVIFEEASGLSREAQEALRVPLEEWADQCRVIFITNDLEKMDKAIRSRCDEIEMGRPPVRECARVLGRILEAEGITAESDTVVAFARRHLAASTDDDRRDLRSLLAEAQHLIETEGSLPAPLEAALSRSLMLDEAQGGYRAEDVKEGAALLNNLTAEFSKYLSLPEGGVEALALWTVFAWAHEAFSISPILTLVSPTMRAGKSTAFEMLEQMLIPETYHPSSITPAALYRLKGIAEPDQATPALEVKWPTLCLLMDEADNWLSLSKDLQGVLNSGWTRRSAFVFRADGKYSSWYPKALALVNQPRAPLPGTVRDRGIIVPMQRKRREEQLVKFSRHQPTPELAALQREVMHWVQAHFVELRRLAAGGEVLAAEELHDRAKDNWHPFMCIARVAGGGWEERARRASLILADTTRETELLIDLLGNIRDVFEAEDADALRSVKLVEVLTGLEAAPWKERRLTPIRLATMLRPLGIRPKPLWIDPGAGEKKNKNGYERSQFTDAFARYL